MSWCTNNFRPSVDTHTSALSEGQHEFHIWIHFKVALLANSNVSSIQFCFISWGAGASAVELRAQKLLLLKDCLWQNRTTIYIRDNFTALCNFHCLYVEKEELFLVQFTSKEVLFCTQCYFFFLNECVSLCVFDWQASQRGHAGVRRVSGVRDVTGERHTYALVRAHKETETRCDRWAAPFSCCLFQLVFGNGQKVFIKIFDDTHVSFCTLHDVKKPLNNGWGINIWHAAFLWLHFGITVPC